MKKLSYGNINQEDARSKQVSWYYNANFSIEYEVERFLHVNVLLAGAVKLCTFFGG